MHNFTKVGFDLRLVKSVLTMGREKKKIIHILTKQEMYLYSRNYKLSWILTY